MSSFKCPQCGLVKFASASNCKRCQLTFDSNSSADAAGTVAAEVAYPFWPPNKEIVEVRVPDWTALSVKGFDPADLEEPAPHTFGTIFFAVCLGLTILLLLYQLHVYSQMGSREEWKALTNTSSRLYVSFYESLVYFEGIFKAGSVAVSAMLFWPLFAKSRRFIRMVSYYLAAQFFYLVVDGWGMVGFESAIRQKHLGNTVDAAMDTLHASLPIYIVSALIIYAWFRYFTSSKRVKKIFVN